MSQEQDSEIIDLGFDVSKEDVQKPLLKKQTVRARCKRVWKAAPNDKGNQFLNIQWEILDPVETVQGAKLAPGHYTPYPQRIMLNPSGGMTEEMIREKLQKVHFALAGEGRVNTGAWLNKEAAVAFTLREAGEDKQGVYREASNEVSYVAPIKK